MKASEIRGEKKDDLVQRARDLRGQLWKARVNNRGGHLRNTAQVQVLRRDLARVLTVLNEGASK